MSGGNVSYNLRPNKFVERQLFIELLGKIVSTRSPDEFVCVSLGGPQLEDQRLVHRRLGVRNLISLEASPAVYERQLFNLRPSYIECRNESTGDFIRDFDEFTQKYYEKTYIIWLDYTSPGQRRDQLVEYQTLLSKLWTRDIVKITMNANSYTLSPHDRDEPWKEVYKRRREALRRQLDGYLPRSLPETISNETLPYVLCEAIMRASLDALQNKPELSPVPIAAFVYQDGVHQMLTVTVCIESPNRVNQFCEELTTRGWEYLPSRWWDCTRIKVPNLTAKERLYIEQKLFSEDDETVHEKLPFRLDQDEGVSLSMLREYARHYCRYPSYFQVVL